MTTAESRASLPRTASRARRRTPRRPVRARQARWQRSGAFDPGRPRSSPRSPPKRRAQRAKPRAMPSQGCREEKDVEDERRACPLAPPDRHEVGQDRHCHDQAGAQGVGRSRSAPRRPRRGEHGRDQIEREERGSGDDREVQPEHEGVLRPERGPIRRHRRSGEQAPEEGTSEERGFDAGPREAAAVGLCADEVAQEEPLDRSVEVASLDQLAANVFVALGHAGRALSDPARGPCPRVPRGSRPGVRMGRVRRCWR